MELLWLIIIVPLFILFVSLFLSIKFYFVGAAVSTFIATTYFHMVMNALQGFGHPAPTSNKQKRDPVVQLKEDALAACISFAVLSVVVLVTKALS
jgi:hypothetical protein